jgi:hypothetical protein
MNAKSIGNEFEVSSELEEPWVVGGSGNKKKTKRRRLVVFMRTSNVVSDAKLLA